MGKRKRDDGADEQKSKRVKNKAKYERKGNKARKRAANRKDGGIGQGANAIPVKVREGFSSAGEENGEGEKKEEAHFVIDPTPMDDAELEEMKKTKGDKKREREPARKEDAGVTEDKPTAVVQSGKKVGKKTSMQSPSKKESRETKKARQETRKVDKKEKKKLKVQKEKKGKKEEEAADSSSSSSSDSDSDSDSEIEEKPSKTNEAAKEDAPAAKESKLKKTTETGKNARFIIFVGNLPFTANLESVTEHFSKISPVSVRVATDKNKTNQCRGFGFVEFEQFDRMQTCLKLYHHSSFDDGKSPARKINVELTAGGGGKSDHRKTKIKEKNEKLAEERAKAAKEKKQQKAETETAGQFAGVHPSRLNRMQ
ncbi:hypothetical protein BGW36DRAFT_355232 [Talaromyces proteolyticus]|uniref:RRM domain-containing protein n=1 Tax=Talaromyces proteolyticus TaxID=1131652 RepID=A0AAD4Q088_9EURO|nr:uncharacterized protein BGW36DRAFT_355232 [Talaromyces proteolyticus]KAH8703833.1 hypothetical protein BGW36DRAFT_355232 [Talaromyces proteolyticus]